jgi:hypothetical protein
MSKGIDYSKWDKFQDSSDEEEDDQRKGEPMTPTASSAPPTRPGDPFDKDTWVYCGGVNAHNLPLTAVVCVEELGGKELELRWSNLEHTRSHEQRMP